MSGITFNGMTGGSAINVDGAGEAITLSHDSFIDNADPSGPGPVEITPGSPTTTTLPTVLDDNTFDGNTASYGGGAYLDGSGSFTVTNNTFVGNSATTTGGVGGALAVAAFGGTGGSGTVTVSGNTFGGTTPGAGNTSPFSGGAAFFELHHGQTLVLDHNQFIGNAIAGSGTAQNARTGGALTATVNSGNDTGFQVVQSNNLFSGNAVQATAASGVHDLPAGGGAEWLFGVSATSSGDVFTGNQVAVNDGAPPQGGALGVLGAAAQNTFPDQPGTFSGTDDLFLNSSVAAGGHGGAIYIGFATPYCTSSCPGSSLTLADSTVSGNSVAAGSGSQGGGLWGGPSDTLALTNSIVDGNSAGAAEPDVFGFGAPSVQYTDVCTAPSGGAPLAGPGNICASPALDGAGRETAASPTIDAGLNSLVPPGLATDAFGNARVVQGRCGGGPVVDMGAFESGVVPCPLTVGTASVGTVHASPKGLIVTIQCAASPSPATCEGDGSLSTTEHLLGSKLVSLSRKHKARRRTKSVGVGHKHFTLSAGQSVSLLVPVNAKGKALLKRFHKLPVKLVVTVNTPTGKAKLTTRHATIKPAHKRKHKKHKR
jgi:parallel beta-helix repeat protein